MISCRDRNQAMRWYMDTAGVISTGKHLIIVAERRRRLVAAMDWQEPIIAYCFDLHPKMHPNFIFGEFWSLESIAAIFISY